MNRIATSIATAKQSIEDKLASGKLTQEKVDKAHKDYDLAFDEYCKFQELKSLASINGTLSLDEANLVYHYLGNTPAHFNRQPVEVKGVLTQIFLKLLKMRIKAA